jgi:hypothetical protein
MPAHVIAATSATTDRPAYFLGYGSRLAVTETLWTAAPWRAHWLDEDEAALEARLLADLHPACTVTPQPLARRRASLGR